MSRFICDILSEIHREMNLMSQAQTISVREAARRLGIGKTLAYEAVKRGEIPAIHVGPRFRIPIPALERLLEEGGKIG